MGQRDYEELPEAPDLGQSVQQDSDETLVGPAGRDPLDAGYVPPDRPYLLEDEAATGPESLDRKLDAERPDDDTGSEPDRAPRFDADTSTADASAAESTQAHDAGIAGGAATAEEAAMHRVDENRR